MDLGVTQNCQNYGSVASEAAIISAASRQQRLDHPRRCWAMCGLSGDDWIGGIAGLAMKLYDCRSLVEIDAGTSASAASPEPYLRAARPWATSLSARPCTA